MEETYLLEMNCISKIFPGVAALKDVSLKIRPGTVHALVGENGAGKSTLMKILIGLYNPDKGGIIFKGKEVKIKNVSDALKLGISMIHQELSPVLDMNIAENIYLGRYPERNIKLFIDRKKMFLETKKLLNKWGLNYDPKTKLRDLSISDIQMIEIVKAISYQSSLIIMDEPTSAISEKEVDKLFGFIRELRLNGISVIMITHRIDEIFKIADEATVLRDGGVIGTKPMNQMEKKEIISMMVGREINQIFPKKVVAIKDIILTVKGLTKKGVFEDISFDVKKGEILGISGLMGAGRTEIVRAIFGLDKFDSGEILFENELLKIKNTSDAIRKGIVMVSEDRKKYGLVLCRSIIENTTLPSLNKYIKGVLLDARKEKSDVKKMIDMLSIKTPRQDNIVNYLSGGNQQKVVIAKWLLMNPKIMILDEPTRGIDVAAKSEIHRLMCDFAEKGMSIIMISSELPEILGMSDRIVIIQSGRVKGILDRHEASQENIMTLATGGSKE